MTTAIDDDHVARLRRRIVDQAGLPEGEAAAAKTLLFAASVFADHAPHDQGEGTSANRFLWSAETAADLVGQIQRG